MTVLFKGFKIDWNNCDDCPASCDCPVCQHIDSYSMHGERPKECPAFELPPHGRLIDADALSMEFWKMRSNYQMMDDSQTADKIMHGLYRAEQATNEAPTIIEAEE